MTISSTQQRNDYLGPGTGPFAFGYRIYLATDLFVQKQDVNGNLTTLNYPGDFSISAGSIGNRSGGTITLTNTLQSTDKLTVQRVRPLTQLINFRNQGSMLPANIEDGFDQMTMLAQQLQNTLNSSVQIPPTLTGFSTTLPAVMAAGQAIVVNAGGTGFSMAALSSAQLSAWNATNNMHLDVFTTPANFTPNVTTQLTLTAAPGNANNVQVTFDISGVVTLLQSDDFTVSGTTITFGAVIPLGTTRVEVRYLLTFQLNTADSGNVTWNQAGVGSVSRFIRDKVRETISVADFGTAGDGVADDSTPWQNAVTYAATFATGGEVVVPPGTYLLNTVALPNNVSIRMHAQAVLKHKASASGAMFTNGVVGTPILGKFSGGQIDGNSANQTSRWAIFDFLNAGTVQDYVISDVRFKNTVLAAATMSIATGGFARMLNCNVTNMANHGPNGGDNSYAARFAGSGVAGNSLAEVRGCYCDAAAPANAGQAAGGFLFDQGVRVICDDCDFSGVGQSYLGNFTGCVVLYEQCDDAFISNIRMRNIRYSGISLQNAANVQLHHITVDGDDGSASVAYGINVDPVTRTLMTAKRYYILDDIIINAPTAGYAIRVRCANAVNGRNMTLTNIKINAGQSGIFFQQFDGAIVLDGFDIANITSGGPGNNAAVELSTCSGTARFINGFINGTTVGHGITTGDGTNGSCDLEIQSVSTAGITGIGMYLSVLKSARVKNCLFRGTNATAIQTNGAIGDITLEGNIKDSGQAATFGATVSGNFKTYGNSWDPAGAFGVTGPTGWTPWTGSAARGTIDTGAATLLNCAQAIKAIIDDLYSGTNKAGIFKT